MGRFASTVAFYSRFREPYAPAFFEQTAVRLHLSGRERLADIGCGPAPLALGFSRFVGSCTGIDPEPAMLEAAREQALQAGVELNLIEARIERLLAAADSFDLVTIGRALHWMEPKATLDVLEHIVAKGGSIVVCGASPPPGAGNPWLEPYNEIRGKWVDHRGEERYSADAEQRFRGSRFRLIDRVVVTTYHWVSVEELVARSLSRSTTSPQVLGTKLAEFKQALADAVRPFALDGVVQEQIEASARIFR